MSLTVFASCGELCSVEESNNDGVLVKKALLLISGKHRDNQGRTHEFSPLRIQRITANTNKALAKGNRIPFMTDHAKTLVYSKGAVSASGDLPLSQLGWLDPDKGVWVKVIEPEDLPNSKQSHLTGKLGIFGHVRIHRNQQDVKSGLIKPLSPGIDLENERIGEVSAVAFPAIQGPALFSEGLDYSSVKQEFETSQKLRDRLLEENEIFFSTIRRIDAAPPEQIVGLDPKAIKLKAIADYSEELKKILELNDAESGGEIGYSPNPYDQNLIRAASYSEVAPPEKPLKRRRKAEFNNSKLLKRRNREK